MKRRETKKGIERAEKWLAVSVQKYLEAHERGDEGLKYDEGRTACSVLASLLSWYLRLDPSWDDKERWIDGLMPACNYSEADGGYTNCFAKGRRGITTACTRPPTRRLSCKSNRSGRRVMPGVMLLLSRESEMMLRVMRLPITLTLLMLCAGCNHPVMVGANHSQGEKMNLEEASMNFDSENVRPFLERLKPRIESGFSDIEILQLQRMMEGLKTDEEKELEFPVRYRGRRTVLRVRIFMDDVNSPDVYFFTDPELAKEIEKELEKFADELGI